MTLLYKTAQSLTEYSLVMGLVALACIGGLAVLGTQIQENMQDALGNQQNQSIQLTSVPSSLNAPTTQAAGFFLSSSEVQNILDQAPSQTLSLGNGKSITLPKPDFNQLQETLGPNGSTEVSIALMERMIAAIKENGENPESIIPELSMFAKNGHQLSAIYKNTESYLANFYAKNNIVAPYELDLQLGIYTRSEGNEIYLSDYTKEADGNYSFTGREYLTNGKTVEHKRYINDVPPNERIHLLNKLVNQKLESNPNLSDLITPFKDIYSAIHQSHSNLGNQVDWIQCSNPNYDCRDKTKPKESTEWLNTKIESNKSCLMSKDQTCLQ
jgi:hypothetical protein